MHLAQANKHTGCLENLWSSLIKQPVALSHGFTECTWDSEDWGSKNHETDTFGKIRCVLVYCMLSLLLLVTACYCLFKVSIPVQARVSNLTRQSHSLTFAAAAAAAIAGFFAAFRTKKQRSLQQGIADFYDASTGSAFTLPRFEHFNHFRAIHSISSSRSYFICQMPRNVMCHLWGVWVEIWGDHLHHGYYEDNSWRPTWERERVISEERWAFEDENIRRWFKKEHTDRYMYRLYYIHIYICICRCEVWICTVESGRRPLVFASLQEYAVKSSKSESHKSAQIDNQCSESYIHTSIYHTWYTCSSGLSLWSLDRSLEQHQEAQVRMIEESGVRIVQLRNLKKHQKVHPDKNCQGNIEPAWRKMQTYSESLLRRLWNSFCFCSKQIGRKTKR